MGEPRDKTAKHKRTKEALRKRTHDLGERVKELHCLYGISNLVLAPGVSLEEMLQGTVDLIPPGWQYPEVTCARITLDGREFRTDSFRETVWRQASDIIVNGEQAGALEVCYLQEEPEADEGSFLKEERDLIDAIAGRLGRVIESRRAEEALRNHAGELEELNRRLVRAYEELDGSRTQLVEKSALLQSLVEAHVVPLSEQLQETASIILSRLAGFVPADAFALAIVSEDQPQVLIFAPARLSRRVTDEIRRRMSEAAEVVLGRKLSRTTPSGFEPIAGGSAKVGTYPLPGDPPPNIVRPGDAGPRRHVQRQGGRLRGRPCCALRPPRGLALLPAIWRALSTPRSRSCSGGNRSSSPPSPTSCARPSIPSGASSSCCWRGRFRTRMSAWSSWGS